MYTTGLGEVLATAFTVNPAIGDIPSASSILDTSNFTFQAVTLGKDAEGFRHHAHTVYSEDGDGLYNGGVVMIRDYGGDPSSYTFTAYEEEFADEYSSMPCYPSIYDTRLERASTSCAVVPDPSLGGVLNDKGHYLNVAIEESLSSLWNVVGGYPPAEGGVYHFLDATGGFQFSGEFEGVYNANGLIDSNGYIKIADGAFNSFNSTALDQGSLMFSSAAIPKGTVGLLVAPRSGDLACLAAFGGIKHIGVYCLDLEAMLGKGLTPPFTWSAVDNTRQYKLVAKVTFMDNLLWHEDLDAGSVAGPVHSGFEDILNTNKDISPFLPGTKFYLYDGPIITLSLTFL